MSFKPLLPLLTATLILTGCATESCKDHPCSPDEKLAEAVRVNIESRPALLADHLKVVGEDGTIYLYGLVSTSLEFAEVEEIAKATPGVKKVVNACGIDNIQR